MLTLLAILSCQSLTNASTEKPPPLEPDAPIIPDAPRAQVALPAGSPIVRECYSDESERRRSANRSTAGRSSPRAPSATAAPPPPSPKPMTTAQAPADSSAGIGTLGAKGGGEGASGYGSGAGGLGNAGPGSASGGAPAAETVATSSPTKSSAKLEKKKADAPAAAAEPAPSPIATGDARANDGLADRSATKDQAGVSRPEVRSMTEESAENESQREQMQQAKQPDMDWGATVYLSNDDSMSLASAQRLLWAIQNRGAVKTSEVRPHEFLNYFSFDTSPVDKGDVFSVKGGAEQTGSDTITLGFAVKGVVPEHKPLDLTLVLDRSGSMTAEGRMDYLKRGLSKMTTSLQRGDRVDLVLFDDKVCTPLENYVVGRDDPALLANAIEALKPRGSTDLDAGLKEGYRIANARTGGDVKGRNRRMLLISDALLNTGDIDPDTVSEVGKAYESSGIRLTAIGVGRDFNDKVLDKLSEKGKGAYVYLGSEAVVDRVFGLGFESLTRTIAHDVKFALDLPPSLAMERFYGEESSTNPDDVQPIHYYAGTTQLFLQDLKLRDGRAVRNDPVTLTVEYRDADTGEPAKQVFQSTVGALMDADPRNMRKGRALMAWTDMILERSMGGNPCGQAFDTYRSRVTTLGDDAELAWLDGLTSPLCGREPVKTAPMVAKGVPYKVKVDSDLPIAEVTLACGGWKQTESLSGSDTIARFDAANTGSCTLTLGGTVPMQSSVTVPATGGDVRCTVRGGRVSCG